MNLRGFYARLQGRFPTLARFLRQVYLGKPFNAVRRKISGKGNSICLKKSILRSVSVEVRGNRNRIEVEDDCLLNHVRFYILGDDHHIQISKGCRFNRGGEIWFEDNGCSLRIGEGTTFEDVHIAVTEPGCQVEIGEDCMFAYDIDIRTGDSHPILDLTSRDRINPGQNIRIGNHVWVAAHSMILKGVTISDNTVVATSSVVTKGFPESGIILAGNPAKVIRENITWLRVHTLEPSNRDQGVTNPTP